MDAKKVLKIFEESYDHMVKTYGKDECERLAKWSSNNRRKEDLNNMLVGAAAAVGVMMFIYVTKNFNKEKRGI